jgi:predicted component of type VI protein secretion system
MSGIELFGFVAVAVMVGAYALEDRGPAFILLFAVSCLAAATYAAFIRSWPFAAVETVWSAVALHRWRKRQSRSKAPDER